MLTSIESNKVTKDPDEVARRVLQTNFTTLRGKLNITNIRCHLYEQRAIDINIYDKLTDNNTNTTANDKSELLLRYLISKGEEGYKQLVQALHQCGKEDPVQASLAGDLERMYMECCSDTIVNETGDGNVNVVAAGVTLDRHQESPSYSPSFTTRYRSDHGGHGSETSSLSSNLRVPSSVGHQMSGQVSVASGSDQSWTANTTIHIDKVTTIKILVLGDKGVGKTSLILKYAKDDFDIHETPTPNLDVISSVINFNDKKYVINFWDPAGQSRPNTLTRRYFQGAHGALLLYDSTRSATLDSIANWQKELSDRVYQRNGDPLPTVLVGTKCDHESCDEVTSGGSSMCRECGFLKHFLTSAKTGKNLKESVNSLVLGILSDPESLKASHYNEEHSVVIAINDSSVEPQHSQHSKNKCCSG